MANIWHRDDAFANLQPPSEQRKSFSALHNHINIPFLVHSIFVGNDFYIGRNRRSKPRLHPRVFTHLHSYRRAVVISYLSGVGIPTSDSSASSSAASDSSSTPGFSIPNVGAGSGTSRFSLSASSMETQPISISAETSLAAMPLKQRGSVHRKAVSISC